MRSASHSLQFFIRNVMHSSTIFHYLRSCGKQVKMKPGGFTWFATYKAAGWCENSYVIPELYVTSTSDNETRTLRICQIWNSRN